MPNSLASCATTNGWANSKAFSRSTYTAIQSLLVLEFIFSVIAETNVTRPSVVPLWGMKPYNSSLNWCLAIVSALLSTMLSTVLDTQLSKDIGLNAFFLSGICSACFQVLGRCLSLYSLSINSKTICLALGPAWCNMLLCTPSDPGADFRFTYNTLFNSRIVKSLSWISSGCASAFVTAFSLIDVRIFSSFSTVSVKLLLLVLLANSLAKCSACCCGSGCLRELGSPLRWLSLRQTLA